MTDLSFGEQSEVLLDEEPSYTGTFSATIKGRSATIYLTAALLDKIAKVRASRLEAGVKGQ